MPLDNLFDGLDPIGIIGSPNTTSEFSIDILEDSIDSPLQGKLFVFGHSEGGDEKLVLTQLTNLTSTNPWHEKNVLKSVIKKRGGLEHLSGDTDVKDADLGLLGVFEYDEQGNLQTSTLDTPPSSGTEVFEVTTEMMERIVEREQGNIFYLGHIYGSDTIAPFRLKHFGEAPEGFGEAHRIGIFGKSGTGKSVIGAEMLGGFAQNDDMGILILDPQGQFSDDRFAAQTEFNFSFHDLLDATRGQGRYNIQKIDDIILENRRSFLLLLDRVGIYDQLAYRTRQKRERLINNLEQWMSNEGISPDELDAHELADEAANLTDLIYSTDKEDEVRGNYNRFDTRIDNTFNQVQELFRDEPGRTRIGALINWVLEDGRIVILDIDPANIGSPQLRDDEVKYAILYGIIQRLRQSVRANYREGEISNALVALDEANEFVPQTEPDQEDLKRLKAQIVDSQEKSRKYGIGWLFINQRIANFSNTVYSQLEDYVFCWGLSVGVDETHVKDQVGQEMFTEYEQLPNPKQSGIYSYMISGGIVGVGTVGTPLIVRGFGGIDELLEANDIEQ